MAQISLYIEDSMKERLNAAAKARDYSVSKYVSTLVNEQLIHDESDELRKKKIFRELKGALTDPTVFKPPELLWNIEKSEGAI